MTTTHRHDIPWDGFECTHPSHADEPRPRPTGHAIDTPDYILRPLARGLLPWSGSAVCPEHDTPEGREEAV